mmetsp:Transcript_15474/g.38998  ORF Transcript_15474/g.38998 Transcript_15474/m.38998 type:complete len:83 (+) Transcript_15474:1410-1658(+)
MAHANNLLENDFDSLQQQQQKLKCTTAAARFGELYHQSKPGVESSGDKRLKSRYIGCIGRYCALVVVVVVVVSRCLYKISLS